MHPTRDSNHSIRRICSWVGLQKTVREQPPGTQTDSPRERASTKLVGAGLGTLDERTIVTCGGCSSIAEFEDHGGARYSAEKTGSWCFRAMGSSVRYCLSGILTVSTFPLLTTANVAPIHTAHFVALVGATYK